MSERLWVLSTFFCFQDVGYVHIPELSSKGFFGGGVELRKIFWCGVKVKMSNNNFFQKRKFLLVMKMFSKNGIFPSKNISQLMDETRAWLISAALRVFMKWIHQIKQFFMTHQIETQLMISFNFRLEVIWILIKWTDLILLRLRIRSRGNTWRKGSDGFRSR